MFQAPVTPDVGTPQPFSRPRRLSTVLVALTVAAVAAVAIPWSYTSSKAAATPRLLDVFPADAVAILPRDTSVPDAASVLFTNRAPAEEPAATF